MIDKSAERTRRRAAPRPGLWTGLTALALVAACEVPPPPVMAEADLWVAAPQALLAVQQGLMAQDALLDHMLPNDRPWTPVALPLPWPVLGLDGSGRLLCDRGNAVLATNERSEGDLFVRQVSLRADDCEIETVDSWPADPWDEESPPRRRTETVRADGTYLVTVTWPADGIEGLPAAVVIDGDFELTRDWEERVGNELTAAHRTRVAVRGLRVRTRGTWPRVAVVWNGTVQMDEADEKTERLHLRWQFDDWTRTTDGAGEGPPTHVAVQGRFRAEGGRDGDHGCLRADVSARSKAPVDAAGLRARRYCFREGRLDLGEFAMTFIDGEKVIGHSGDNSVDLECRAVRNSWLDRCFGDGW